MSGILEIIIKWLIPTVLGALLSWLAVKYKSYKIKHNETENNNSVQNEALLFLLQNAITNQYFVFAATGCMEDYQYRNWLNLVHIYEKLGGDDYVHTLVEKIKKFKIKKTDILPNN